MMISALLIKDDLQLTELEILKRDATLCASGTTTTPNV